MKHKLVFVLALVLVLGLAGCGQQLTAEEIVAKMQDTLQNTQDAHAVVSGQVAGEGMDVSATVEIWEKAPNLVRAQVLESSRPEVAGAVVVVDGSKGWYYEPARNRVVIGVPGEMEMPLPEEILLSMQDTIQQVLNVTDVELAGEEEVLGRPAYKLVLTPKEGTEFESVAGSATLWVDKEQWIVLKALFEVTGMGQGSMEVRSFELNPGLPADLFTFQVPEGAEVVEVEAEEPVPVTLDEARAQAGFVLLVPGYVPGGATLIEVFKLGDSIIQRYDHSQEVSFTIVQGPELAGPPPLGNTQELTVRGQPATLVVDEAGGNTFLYWTENGVTITLAGHIGLAEALQVAESLQ